MKISNKRPRVGLAVQYVTADGDRRGEARAAIITKTFHPDPELLDDGATRQACEWCVNLTLFADQHTHAPGEERHPYKAPYNADGEPGTWHWIPDDGPDFEVPPDPVPDTGKKPKAKKPDK